MTLTLVREATSVSTGGPLLRVGTKRLALDSTSLGEPALAQKGASVAGEPTPEEGSKVNLPWELTETNLDADQRRKHQTLPGGRYPMPDKKHARLALAFIDKGGLSPEEKAKVRARAHSILGTTNTEAALAERSGLKRESLTFYPKFIPASVYGVENGSPLLESDYDDASRTATVIIIEEGVGNKRDMHYYSPETLHAAVQDGVFEGAQAFADHPGADEDINRPERSIRDLVGYYFDTKIVEVSRNGVKKTALAAKLRIQQGVDWVVGLIKEAIAYAKQFPNKTYVGISINADGDTAPTTYLGQEVNGVVRITDAFSADMVTKPARGGRFLALVESQRGSLEKGSMGKLIQLKEAAAKIKTQIAGGHIDEADLKSLVTLCEAADDSEKTVQKELDESKTKECSVAGHGANDHDEECGGMSESMTEAKCTLSHEHTADCGGLKEDSFGGAKGKHTGAEAAVDGDLTESAAFREAVRIATAQHSKSAEEDRKELIKLRAKDRVRESVDFVKRKLVESKLPESAAKRIFASLVGLSESEVTERITNEVEFCKELGLIGERKSVGFTERTSLTESDTKSNGAAIFAGLGD
jgi:hypothetical protein